MELDKAIQDRIDSLIDKSDGEFQAGNHNDSFSLLFEAWDLFPEPKKNWNESFNLVTYIINDYLTLENLTDSEKWIKELETIDDHLNISRGTVCFIKGRFFYEKGDYEKARENFKESVKEGKGFRYFEDEDPKYLEFYSHPEKHKDQ